MEVVVTVWPRRILDVVMALGAKIDFFGEFDEQATHYKEPLTHLLVLMLNHLALHAREDDGYFPHKWERIKIELLDPINRQPYWIMNAIENNRAHELFHISDRPNSLFKDYCKHLSIMFYDMVRSRGHKHFKIEQVFDLLNSMPK